MTALQRHFLIAEQEPWQNDVCGYRAMTIALAVSYQLVSF